MQENPLINKNNNIINKSLDDSNIKEMILSINNNSNKNNSNVNNNINNNNGTIRLDYYGHEISKNNKKHRISFIDQIESKKEIAQIIYFNNEQSSLKEDKIDTNKYFQILRKQSTNISEFTKKENQNQNEAETYKIKRPKSSNGSRKFKRKKDEKEENCSCQII